MTTRSKIKASARAAALLSALLMILPLLFSCSHEHEFGEWVTDEQKHTRSCTVKKCEETESGEHEFGEPATVKEPGAQTEGLREYKCTVCGYSYTETVPQRLSLTLEEFDEFDTHTALQKKYLSSPVSRVPAGAVGELEQSTQGSPIFTWHLEGLAEGEELTTYTLAISDKEDMSDAKTYKTRFYQYDRNNGFNFYIRWRYYWQVTATVKLADGTEIEEKSKISTFRTLDGPRTLSVDGIAIFRDLGGVDADGGQIRQGMIFRCGRLNTNYKKQASVSATGKKTLIELGIKTEIDLRGAINDSGVYQNGFKADGSETMYSWGGDQINYYLFPAIYYGRLRGPRESRQLSDHFPLLDRHRQDRNTRLPYRRYLRSRLRAHGARLSVLQLCQYRKQPRRNEIPRRDRRRQKPEGFELYRKMHRLSAFDRSNAGPDRFRQKHTDRKELKSGGKNELCIR